MRKYFIILAIIMSATQLVAQSVRPAGRSSSTYTLELDLPGLTINIPTRRDVAAPCTQGGSDPGRATTDYHFTYNTGSCTLTPFRQGCFTRRNSSVEGETRADGIGTRPTDGQSYTMTIEGYSKNYRRVGPDCEITFDWRNTGSVRLNYEDFRATGSTSRTFCVNDANLSLSSLVSYSATWSGPGVSGTTFRPATAGAGTHTIRATRSYDNGTSTVNFTFTVVGLPNVNAGGNFTRCFDDSNVVLTSGVSPSGGTWSGNGIRSGNQFDPSAAGVGNHTLTYTFTNASGCTNSDTRVATVAAEPNANAGPNQELCSGEVITLTGSPAGGTWSGLGMSGNQFVSGTLGAGNYDVRYTYTSPQGCSDFDETRITINANPNADAGSDDQRCITSSQVTLSGSPSGGTWSGPGISGNNFRPNVAGIGNHTLTYSVTDSDGCSDSDTKVFRVVSSPTVNAGSDQTVCIDDSRFFVGGFSPTGGSWSGPGISSSGRFDPGDAGIGTHTLTYNWNDGTGCSGSDTKRITVRGLPSVNAGSNVTYCVGSGRYTQSASPSGGTWSGQGMVGSRFDTDIVGPGNYTITYTYTDGNGCRNSDSKVVTVQAGPSVNAGSDQTVCVTSLPFSLNGVSPAGGNWDSHPGISGSTFNPANAGVGTHILRYRFTNPFGCDGFDSKTVNVLAQPTIDVGSDINVCVSDPEFLITGALPAGGSWAGDGVVAASRFNAALAGVGTHVITYTYTNAGGCSNSAAKNVVVTGLASVEAGVDLNRCINAGILTLDGESPTGGTWSGPGVVNGNEFNPVLAGLGVHEVIYSYSDLNGCIATDSRNVIVDNADPIDAGRNQLACITDAPFPLDGASEPGGTWSGPGVSGNLFDASVAGVGTHELTYDFISLGGCASSDITFITVVANDAIDAGDPITLCINDGFFNLQNGVSVTGGDFSGNGVVSNAFDPSLAGLGTHTITYVVTNPNGCLTSDTREVTVIDPAPVDIGVDITFCVSDLPYDLTADVTVAGGTFSGLGVVGSNFDPSLVGAGAFEISYEVNDANGCASTDTRIIYVTSPGEVDAGQNFAVCAGSGVVDLSQNASPNTGVWSGMGITGNIFDPTALTPGDYVLRYTITNGFGCDAFDEILVTVTNALVIDAGPDQNVCEGGEALDLYTVVSIPGGDFEGENISGNIFDVQRADPGTYAITYNYSNEFGCDDSDVLIITVNAVPEVVAGSDIDVCLNQDPVDLTIGAIPAGGSFEGAGVIGNFFNPAIAGIGRHDVFYTFTNVNGCSTTEVREITVQDLPQVEVGNNLVLCIDQGAYDLGEDVDPLGGEWSGSGVDLSNFEPLVAGIGIHELVYTVTLPSGCTNSATQFITVVEPESVYAGDDMVVCTSTNSIDLSATATPFGGEFDGVGVSGLNFRPSSVSPGEYTITYTYNSAGCDVVDTRKITVTDVPTVNAGPDTDLCINQDPVDMSVGTFPSGGVLSGPGLTGNVFDPARAGLGDHLLNYTYASAGGCVVTDQKVITVEEPPSINAGGNISHCINGGQINLALDVSESGGVFFGTGVVSGGIFDPLIAGIGTHQITYTFNQANGCVSTDTRLITINNIPVLDIGGDFELCTNAGTYPLIDDVNINGGVFSGPGVSGNILDPSRLSPGSYNIEYELETAEGCIATEVRTISIVEPDMVDAGPNVEICLGESLDLNLSVSIPGGNFLGSGVNGNVFSSTDAGIGEHEITYSIIDANGCDAQDTRTIEVVAPITIDAGENVSVCYDDGQYNLFDDVNEAGGYFIGNGIVGGFFDPQIAGEGVHVLTYRLESSPLCISEDTKVITVTRPVAVDAGMDITLCTDDGVYNLAADVNLSGGEFDGVGVNGSSFDPGDVSPGSYTITYTRLDAQGCASVDERTIEVFGLPILDIGADIELCVNTTPINLALDAIPAGGTFIGNGISGNIFDPMASGTGIHVIRYEYENAVSGCENITTRTLTVVNPRVVGVPPTIVECIDGNVIDLNREDGVIDGTIFSGPGISNNNFFPSVAGAGIHEITATLDEGNGCSSTRTFEAIISPLPDLDFGVDLEVCIDNGIIDLSQEVNLLGGEFDGIGVNRNNFDPENAGPGTFTITYDFSDANGCSNSISKNIRVIGLTDIELGADRSTCIGAGTIDLNVIASPGGGTWSGVGVDVTNIFDPTVAGIGDHILTYTYLDPVSGCESSESIEIEVDDSPNIEVPSELRMCLSDPRIDLRDLDDIVSGTQFSGTGVVNNEFNPALAGVGTHLITAVINVTADCSNSDTFEVIVSDPTVVDFGIDLTMCSNDPLVDLTSEVDVQGGIFSGTGVNGSLFDPSDAGFGTHILDYQFTNAQGCTTTAFKAITVNSSPDVRIDDDDPRVFCEDDNRLNLFGLTNDAGTWSGTGVSGIFFDPTVAGIGDHWIYLSESGSAGCNGVDSVLFSVVAVPSISFDPAPITLCEAGNKIDLSSLVNIEGGDFSGPGVDGTLFDPSETGIGSFQVRYEYTSDLGCQVSVGKQIEVSPLPTVGAGNNVTFCLNQAPVDLTIGSFPLGGSYTGPGVIGNDFDPAQAGIGDHTITYTFVDANGCSGTDQRDITVNGGPQLEVGDNFVMCTDDNFYDLNQDVNITGGTWSGPGITLSNFYPAVAGEGAHELVYTYVEAGGCSAVARRFVTVVSPGSSVAVDAGSDITVCNSASIIDLSLDATPAGGVFSGIGVVGLSFDPSLLVPGIYTVNYSVDNGGCSTIGSRNITVVQDPLINAGADAEQCVTSTTFDLSIGSFPSGGTFIGAGVIGNNFNASAAGLGIHEISYVYDDPTGCRVTDTRLLTVSGPGIVDAGDDIVLCIGDDNINLLEGTSEGSGEFTGSGVVLARFFDPSAAGVGNHIMNYSFTSPNGCVSTDTKVITVLDVPALDIGSDIDVCRNAASINLIRDATVTGGEFTGIGVNNGFFNPNELDPGVYTVEYSLENGQGCIGVATRDITVVAEPVVNAGADIERCIAGTSIDLSAIGTPLGGSWSGPGINVTNIFEPVLAGIGEHDLTYTYTDPITGCAASDELEITISSVPDLQQPSTMVLCESDAILDLTELSEAISGVTFSGTGVTNGLFNPVLSGSGSHVITMAIDLGQGCVNSVQFNIIVNPSTVVTFGSDLVLCSNDDPINLAAQVNVAGGEFDGQGVTGSVFNPEDAGFGTHSVTYTFTNASGCITEATKSITVNTVADVVIDDDEPIETCINSDRIVLTALSDSPGNWSGSGVSTVYFEPSNAGIGDHWIKLTATGQGGCQDADSVLISVYDVPTVTFDPNPIEVCATGNDINLNSLVNVTGGLFEGIGVDDNVFSPDGLTAGTYTVSYEYATARGCGVTVTKDIEVLAVPVVNAGADLQRCVDASVVDLSSLGTPLGGVWSGPGINVVNTFDPTLAGIGDHELIYTYTDVISGCAATDILQFSVVDIPQLIEPSTIVACASDPTINLKELDEATNGVSFSGPGVTNGIFDPAVAGQGNHVITMAVDLGAGCTNSLTFSIIVNPTTTVDFGANLELCSNEEPINLVAQVDIAGGEFEGQGVNGSVFDPAIAGFGTHLLTYTFVNGDGCVSTATKSITVNTVDDVEINDNQPIETCIDDERIVLTGLSDSPGTWSGNGVSAVYFEPSNAGIGDHWIKLTATGQGGCQDVDSVLISVYDIPVVNFDVNPVELCITGNDIDLNGLVNLTGGTFSGIGVDDNLFSPQGLAAGTYRVTYDYQTAIGCSASATKDIEILEVPTVNAGANIEVCIDATAIDLSATGAPLGGTWSGPGIIAANSFEPTFAGIGTFTIFYTVVDGNGCENTATKEVVVSGPPIIDAGANSIVCLSNDEIDLDLNVSVAGGTWSGTGVNQGFFNAGVAGVGSHALTYSLDDGNGCISSDVRVIQVRADITVDAGTDLTFCLNDGRYNLTNDSDRPGGIWSGLGVSGNFFDPSVAGVGDHVITYTFQDAVGCIGTDTRTMTINDIPAVNAGPTIELCSTNGQFDLSTQGFPTGGVWSGQGVNGDDFDPAFVGIGSFTLTYTITDGDGCSSSDQKDMIVQTPPAVDAGATLIVCLNSEQIDLDLSVSVAGGTWSGTGVDQSFFDPAAAGIGNYALTYTIDDGNGCISSDERIIQVREDITVNAGSDLTMCINEGQYNLTNDPDRGGGTWSGLGIDGDFFDPAIAGIGVHVITYSFDDAVGCETSDSRTITVNDVPTVNAGPPVEICSTNGVYDLSTQGFPSGGIWTGQGVTGNNFDPLSVGTGDFTLTYTVTDLNGCSGSSTKEVNVELPPVVDAGPTLIVCINSEQIDLDLDVSQAGGTWSGTGVDQSFFDPAASGIGNYTLTYTIDDGNGCISSDERVIQVREDITVDAGSDLTMCINEGQYNLTNDPDRGGGTWTGLGVDGDFFDPAIAGIGVHVITYTFGDAVGCETSDSRTITVNDVPTVNAGPPVEICSTNGIYDLSSQGFPGGGIWSGQGVTGNDFDPALVGSGEFILTYTVTDLNGCDNSSTKEMRVELPAVVDAGPTMIVCVNRQPIDLDIDVSQAGGIWSGTGVDQSFFDPAASGVGNYTLTYTIDDGNGCISSDERIIQVREDITVDAGSDLTFCVNDGQYNLSNDPDRGGGIWTGLGVDGDFFDPSVSGVGVHTLTYSYDDAVGCAATDTRTITVNDIPTVNAGPPVALCSTNGLFDLSSQGFPTGGVWSGQGVNGNDFDPALVGFGNFALTYTVTDANGCSASATKEMNVEQPPAVDAGPTLIVCMSSEQIDLDLDVSQTGGTWSGTGVNSSFFDPAVAGAGSFSLTYTLDDGNGCISTDTRVIQVREDISISAGVDLTFCLNDGQYDLTNDPDKLGGIWTGLGVDGNFFDPSIAGVGDHTLTYSFEDAVGCVGTDTRTITVNDIPTVNAGPPVTLCSTNGLFDLSAQGFPTGGVWSGQGVTGNNFDPEFVGSGNFTLTYTVTDLNGCSNSSTKEMSVELPPVVDAGPTLIVCMSSEQIDLDLDVSQTGGSWSGTGIDQSFFVPSVAGAGSFSLTYTLDDGNGCISTDTRVIQVRNDISVDAGTDLTLCLNDGQYDLTNDPDKLGGTWTGLGVSGNFFNPSVSGVGNHILTYSFEDAVGCVGTDTRTITVNDIPTVNAGPPLALCSTNGLFDLSGQGFPTGGVWSGQGVTGNNFDPEFVGSGNFTLTYTVTNPNGCSNSSTKEMSIELPAVIDAGPTIIVCRNSDEIDLDLEVSQTGGTWSGTGVNSSFFDPAVSGTGSFSLTYSLDDGKGCISTDIRVIQVRNNIDVDAGDDLTMCLNDGRYNLANDPDKFGGTWAGLGIAGDFFNPSVAGVGDHLLTYTFEDAVGCVGTDTRTITVNDIPTVNAGPPLTLCSTNGLFDLSGQGFPTGGIWTGQGVTDNEFNPAIVGAGDFALTYTVTDLNGCSNSSIKEMNVELPPAVDAGPTIIVCLSSEEIDLDLEVSQAGGTWSGTGVNSSFFDPAAAGTGSFTLTYTLDDGNGCISTDVRIIQVRTNIDVDAGSDLTFCVNDGEYDLTNDPDRLGGIWTGTGVSGNTFDPLISGVGTHTLTYNFQDAVGCTGTDTRTFTVNDIPVANAGPAIELCTTNGLFDLSAQGFPSGGVWTGQGVTDNEFNPALVGAGDFSLTYTVTDVNGCSSSDTKELIVDLPASIDAGASIIVCTSNPAIDLDLEVSEVGGTWVGTGVEQSFFEASVAGIGIHTLTYTLDRGNGCISSDVRVIQVRDNILVDAGVDLAFCVSDGAYDLTNDPDRLGGSWTGLGIDDDFFDPAIAGVGTHTLTYNFEDAVGCSGTDTRTVTVTGSPQVDGGPDISSCVTGDKIDLSVSSFPTGGTWSGPGVTGNDFNPAQVGVGNYTVTYTILNDRGCIATDTKEISVDPLPIVDAGSGFDICINAAPVELEATLPSEGGVWSGASMLAGRFDPLAAGVGSHTLTYTFTDNTGCSNTDSIAVTVLEEPDLTIGDRMELCISERPYDLRTDVNVQGGEFQGPGVRGNFFDPAQAGEGSAIISYTIRFGGCTITEFRDINVNELTDVEIGEDLILCVDSQPYRLLTDVNQLGGTFEGPGIEGDQFDPVIAGIGSHVIEYTFENAFGCSVVEERVITVQDQLNIDAGPDLSLCNSVATYDLAPLGAPSGGIYVGNGVTDNRFDPSVTGNGNFIVTYVIESDNGCISFDSLTVTVLPSSITEFGIDTIVCVGSSPITLNFNEELAGGDWSGTGVVNNQFFPALSGEGTFDLSYQNSRLNCDVAGRRSITVVGLPSPATSNLTSVGGCDGEFVELNAQITEDDRLSNVEIHWFRDGETAPFDIGEIVTFEIEKDERIFYQSVSQFGCGSGQSNFISINRNNPTARIEVDTDSIDFGKPVRFYAMDVENAVSFEWDFGNGTFSTEENPYQYFYESGTFDVSLKLTSSVGCQTTITETDFISVRGEIGRPLVTSVEDEPTGVINYYPNPVTGNILHVDFRADASGEYEVFGVPMNGTKILLGHVTIAQGLNEISIDVNQLPIGVNVVHIVNFDLDRVYNLNIIKLER